MNLKKKYVTIDSERSDKIKLLRYVSIKIGNNLKNII